ncbi:MAG TPA: type II secretion system F family protein [Candidatus Cloacimonadota bacterium]|nr:type II secretion system F family protein [Candidatus Cloacimonadota bacterium]
MEKRDFFYYITMSNKKKVKGRQSAFSADEIKLALQKLGYQKIKVEPILLDFKIKPPFEAILMFINLSAFMLKEKMTYDKILEMLADEESNPVLKETLKNIQNELKKGREGEEVFKQYEHVFGKFPAYMLGLATKSGNMAEVYDATAKFMERDMEYRKSLKQAIMSPAFTVFAMLLAVFYYLISIFPTTAKMFIRFGLDVPPMTKGTLIFSDFMAVHWWWILLIIFIPPIFVFMYWRSDVGQVARDKMLINLPIIGPLLHKSSIEIFFRVFSAIYSGAENNIETLRASAEACRNKYMEKGVKEIAIPMMLKEGAALVPALQASGVFNRTTLNRLRSGAETGNVVSSAEQIAKFYEQETTYKMQSLIMSIQSLIGAFIGIVITALTVVSSEVAMISPKTPGM